MREATGHKGEKMMNRIRVYHPAPHKVDIKGDVYIPNLIFSLREWGRSYWLEIIEVPRD